MKIFILILLNCIVATAFAKILTIETDHAIIYAVNAATIWTPDIEKRQLRLEGIANNKFNYSYTLRGEKVSATSGLNYNRTTNQLTPIIEESLLSKGKIAARVGAFSVGLKEETSISPAEMSKFVNAEEALFKLQVIKQGNPNLLENDTKNTKLAGNLLGLATLGIAVDRMGLSNGFNVVGSSGLGQSIASLPEGINKEMIYAIHGLPSDERWMKYKAIDVFYGPSQVIIAYKNDKSMEIHDQSLALAINKMLDISKEEIMQFWAEDYALRQKIWANCVTSGDTTCRD